MEVDTNPLCACCLDQNLVPTLHKFLAKYNVAPEEENDTHFQYHVNVHDLEVSIDAACPWCKKVLASIDRTELSSAREEHGDSAWITVQYYFQHDSTVEETVVLEIRAAVYVGWSENLDWQAEGGFLIADILYVPHSIIMPAGDRLAKPFGTSESACKDWALERLSMCSSYHPACAPAEYGNLPSRVIDVSPDDATETEPGCIKVHISKPDEVAKFAALSYVWGGERNLRLTTSNMDRFTERIEHGDLPPAIQDAVYFTRLLGVRYLWVDALCILQDDRADKKKEIKNMRHIYKDAHFVIVASQAPSVYDQFLPRVQTIKILDSIEQRPEDSICFKFRPWLYNKFNEPISTRAWSVEERLLPRNLFIFTRQGPVYQCQEDVQGFKFGERENRELIAEAYQTNRLLSRSRDTGYKLASARTDKVLEFWYEIVADYTNRTLTNLEDKLHAIAGVGSEISSTRPTDLGTYMAGIWSKPALEGLLWRKRQVPRPKPLPTLRVAPSWSWAAIDGAVEYKLPKDDMAFKVAAEVLGFETQHTENDEYGALEGSVTVKGPALEATLIPTGNSHRFELGSAKDMALIAAPDFQGAFPSEEMQVTALIMLQYAMKAGSQLELQGLIFTPSEGDRYQRIGSFSGWSFDESTEGASESFQAATREVKII